MRKFYHSWACLIAAFLAISVTDAAESDVQAIERTYKAWVNATNEKNVAKWSAFHAEDPYFSPADASPLTSTEAVLAYYEKSFSYPEFSLDCEQLEVDVSRSGDMAWSRGVCETTFTGPDGEGARGSSRWLKVCKKYPDVSWRGQIDSWKITN